MVSESLFGSGANRAPVEAVQNPAQKRGDELGRTGFEASPLGKALQFIISGGGQYNANTQQYQGGISSMLNRGIDTINNADLSGPMEAVGQFGDDLAGINPINRVLETVAGVDFRSGDGLQATPAQPDTVTQAAEAAAVADQYMQGFEQEMQLIDKNFQLYSALDTAQLPTHLQQQVNEAKGLALQEIDRIDAQIANVEATMHLYDVLMNPENLAAPNDLAVAGFPTDNPMGNALTHLAARMGMTPGGAATANQEQLYDFAEQGEQLVQGAADGKVGQEQLDEYAAETAAVMAGNQVASARGQLDFNLAAQQSINDLVESRKAIQSEFEGINTALENEAVAQQDAKFVMGYDPTPQGAFNDAYVGVVSDTLQDFLGDSNLTPDQEDQLVQALMPFGTYLDTAFDPDSPNAAALDQQIQQVATAMGVDKTVVKDAIMNAREAGKRAQQEVAEVGKGRLKAGSAGMAHLVYQAAEEEVGDEAARMLANSPSMHRLLSVVSKGRPGFESKNGSMAGLGALPRSVYQAMGINYDDIKGDAVEEARALVRYVNVYYAGDAAAALRDFSENKSWGTRVEPVNGS